MSEFSQGATDPDHDDRAITVPPRFLPQQLMTTVTIYPEKYLSARKSVLMSIFRICPTRSTIGMSSVSNVLSVRKHWLISHLLRRMTRYSVPIAMTTTLLPGVMDVRNRLEEVKLYQLQLPYSIQFVHLPRSSWTYV